MQRGGLRPWHDGVVDYLRLLLYGCVVKQVLLSPSDFEVVFYSSLRTVDQAVFDDQSSRTTESLEETDRGEDTLLSQ